MGGRYYTAQDIAELCSIKRYRVDEIRRRGYFDISYSEENPEEGAKYKLVKKRFEISACFVDKDRDCNSAFFYYNQKTLDSFLEGVAPIRLNWPSAFQLEQEIDGCFRNYVRQVWKRGCIRGRTSLIRGRLYIHPEDAELLKLDRDYYASKVARELGVTYRALVYWSDAAPEPFLKESIGIRRLYVPPQVSHRLKRIKDFKGQISKESLRHLYDPELQFDLYINGVEVYNPDSPPHFNECCKWKRIYYPGKGFADVIQVQPDPFIPVMKVRFDEFEKPKYRESLLILSR